MVRINCSSSVIIVSDSHSCVGMPVTRLCLSHKAPHDSDAHYRTPQQNRCNGMELAKLEVGAPVEARFQHKIGKKVLRDVVEG